MFNHVKFTEQGNYFLESDRISDYFGTKYTIAVHKELALWNFEDEKIGDFFNLEQVHFRMTLIKWPWKFKSSDWEIIRKPV